VFFCGNEDKDKLGSSGKWEWDDQTQWEYVLVVYEIYTTATRHPSNKNKLCNRVCVERERITKNSV